MRMFNQGTKQKRQACFTNFQQIQFYVFTIIWIYN